MTDPAVAAALRAAWRECCEWVRLNLFGPEWRVVIAGSWKGEDDALVTTIHKVRARTRVVAASKAMKMRDIQEDYTGKNRDWIKITLRVFEPAAAVTRAAEEG